MRKFLYRKILIPALALCIAIPGVAAYATGNIENLQNQSNNLSEEIKNQQNQFYNVVYQISEIEAEIAENLADIEETELNLEDAILAEQKQYTQMKLRIQHNYEHKEESIFTIILSSSSFSDFLNQIQYANSIYEYDSQMLDSYEATRIEIEEIRQDLETQKANLALKQESLNQKKRELEQLIAATKEKKEDVDKKLAEAKAEAARRAAAEAAARAARLAAERAAASAAAANAAAAASGNKGGGGSAGGVVNADPAPVTDVSGSAVVSYANQFVGGPYVWGGNSLTNGVDCSGFVVQVYKHFGIDLSGTRNSAALRGVGKAVSYDNMKAGDIVCYSGHVGIYTGAGTIVEAQSTRAGITNNRSVNNKTILAIRRVI